MASQQLAHEGAIQTVLIERQIARDRNYLDQRQRLLQLRKWTLRISHDFDHRLQWRNTRKLINPAQQSAQIGDLGLGGIKACSQVFCAEGGTERTTPLAPLLACQAEIQVLVQVARQDGTDQQLEARLAKHRDSRSEVVVDGRARRQCRRGEMQRLYEQRWLTAKDIDDGHQRQLVFLKLLAKGSKRIRQRWEQPRPLRC